MKKNNSNVITEQSPLIIAVINNNLPEIKSLIEAGEDVNSPDKQTHFFNNEGKLEERKIHYYPVDLATLLDRNEARDILLASGAIRNQTEGTQLYKIRQAKEAV